MLVSTTPMMKQYQDAKAACPDALLLFRMGDFYELFFEDAKTAARLLNLALTSRDKGENGVPMAGFPYHQLESYLGKLIAAGMRVAICDQVEDAREAKGLVLRLEWRPDAPRRVSGDPGRLRQVLGALLRDSIGRLERGEVALKVARGRLGSVGGGVRITVEDTGPAIPDDLLPTLFEPFARADASPWRDSRLALPIAHHLVRLMGGDLEVTNLPGAGSRFTFSLPMLQKI